MNATEIDISRCSSPFSTWNKVARVLWGVAWLCLFRLSPRPCHGWRRFLLRRFGAKIGRGVALQPSCWITMPWKLEMGDYSSLGEHVICYSIGQVRIGGHSTISQYAHLCSSTHDYEHPYMPQVLATIEIEDQVWICADAFIAPGVRVGQGAVVGARASVFHNVEPWTVVGGNPARLIKKRVLRSS